MAAENAVTIRGLCKVFDGRAVLDDVDLDIRRGSITAILGPNASGKSTLIKCILALVHPDRGNIEIDGRPIAGRSDYRAGIGYMPQIAHFPDNLTVDDLFALLKDLRGRSTDLDIELFARYDLGTVARQRLNTLSGGTRQKVNAAVALMFNPSLLIFDEPTVGLDPVSTATFKDKVKRLRDEGRTVILSSHLVPEVEELADAIVYLLEGRPAFTGSVDEIKQRANESRLERAIVRVVEESHASHV